MKKPIDPGPSPKKPHNSFSSEIDLPMKTAEDVKLAILKAKRAEMIDHLIREKAFTLRAASIAVDKFLSTLDFVVRETGSLP